MPTADNVNPQRWTNRRILFDNGWYSLIAGDYQNQDGTTTEDCLGERWNGTKDEVGFPNVSGYPVWHVVPEFLELPILRGLVEELARCPNEQVGEQGVKKGQEAGTRTQRVLEEVTNRVQDE